MVVIKILIVLNFLKIKYFNTKSLKINCKMSKMKWNLIVKYLQFQDFCNFG